MPSRCRELGPSRVSEATLGCPGLPTARHTHRQALSAAAATQAPQSHLHLLRPSSPPTPPARPTPPEAPLLQRAARRAVSPVLRVRLRPSPASTAGAPSVLLGLPLHPHPTYTHTHTHGVWEGQAAPLEDKGPGVTLFCSLAQGGTSLLCSGPLSRL